MPAKNKEHFIKTWNEHIDELYRLGHDPKVHDEVKAIQLRLIQIVSEVADRKYHN